METAFKWRLIITALENFCCVVDRDFYLTKAQKKNALLLYHGHNGYANAPYCYNYICMWHFLNSLKVSWDVLTYCWLIYNARTYVGWEITALSAVWFPSNVMNGSMKTVSFESSGCWLLRFVRRSYGIPAGEQVWGHMILGSCVTRDGWSGLLGRPYLPVSPHNQKICCLSCCYPYCAFVRA
jgi:hypothetical protein